MSKIVEFDGCSPQLKFIKALHKTPYDVFKHHVLWTTYYTYCRVIVFPTFCPISKQTKFTGEGVQKQEIIGIWRKFT